MCTHIDVNNSGPEVYIHHRTAATVVCPTAATIDKIIQKTEFIWLQPIDIYC